MKKMIKIIFLDHPKDIGETYLEHFKHALYFSFLLLIASLTCAIHAFFPFVFKTTASTIAYKVSKRRYKIHKNIIKLKQ